MKKKVLTFQSIKQGKYVCLFFLSEKKQTVRADAHIPVVLLLII